VWFGFFFVLFYRLVIWRGFVGACGVLAWFVGFGVWGGFWCGGLFASKRHERRKEPIMKRMYWRPSPFKKKPAFGKKNVTPGEEG